MKIRFKDFLLVPNLITLIRIILLPIILILLLKSFSPFWILVLMIIFILSDFLDGYLARRLEQISDLGKILDPLLDKLGIALFAFYAVIYKNFPVWAMVMIIAKDTLVLLGGVVIIKAGKQIPIADWWGKITVCAWALVLLSYIFEITIIQKTLLAIAVVMLFLNLIYYVKRFVRAMSVIETNS